MKLSAFFRNFCRGSDFLTIRVSTSGAGSFEGASAGKELVTKNDSWDSIRNHLLSSHVIMVGVASFKLIEIGSETKVLCHLINIPLILKSPLKLNPETVGVLGERGFDFNSVVEGGWTYYYGSTRPHMKGHEFSRCLLQSLLNCSSPILVGNDLIDMAGLWGASMGDVLVSETSMRLALGKTSTKKIFTLRGNERRNKTRKRSSFLEKFDSTSSNPLEYINLYENAVDVNLERSEKNEGNVVQVAVELPPNLTRVAKSCGWFVNMAVIPGSEDLSGAKDFFRQHLEQVPDSSYKANRFFSPASEAFIIGYSALVHAKRPQNAINCESKIERVEFINSLLERNFTTVSNTANQKKKQ